MLDDCVQLSRQISADFTAWSADTLIPENNMVSAKRLLIEGKHLICGTALRVLMAPFMDRIKHDHIEKDGVLAFNDDWFLKNTVETMHPYQFESFARHGSPGNVTVSVVIVAAQAEGGFTLHSYQNCTMAYSYEAFPADYKYDLLTCDCRLFSDMLGDNKLEDVCYFAKSAPDPFFIATADTIEDFTRFGDHKVTVPNAVRSAMQFAASPDDRARFDYYFRQGFFYPVSSEIMAQIPSDALTTDELITSWDNAIKTLWVEP